MSEFDELRRLRDADPVRNEAIPSADGPAQRALRERIVMSEQSTTWWRTRAAAMSAAAAAVVLVAAGVVFATQGGDTPEPDPGPVVPPGTAMCVELYSLESLANREMAFDGTVASVDGDKVTFTVGEWFTGGSAAEITLEGAQTIGGITSAGETVSLDPGSRLLVAGDDTFAWGCGFTQAYDEGVAADWRATFA